MENDSSPKADQPADPEGLLRDLAADRIQLADHATAPQWFAPAFGFIAAAYTSAPVFPGTYTKNTVLVLGLLAVIALLAKAQRTTGVKLSEFSITEWLLFTTAAIGALGLFSVSLALVSLKLNWWVIATTLGAFILVTVICRRITSTQARRVADGR